MLKSIKSHAVPTAAPNIVISPTRLVTRLILFMTLSGWPAANAQLSCSVNLLAPVSANANSRVHVDVGSVVDFVEEAKTPDHLYDIHAHSINQAAPILAGRVHFDTPATRVATEVMLEVSRHEHAPLSMARLMDTDAYANLSLDLVNNLPPTTHVIRVHDQGPKPYGAPGISRLEVDVHRDKVLIFSAEAYGIYHGDELIVDDQTGHGPALSLLLVEQNVPVIQSEALSIRYFNGTKHNPQVDRLLLLTRKLAQRIYPHASHFTLQAVGGNLDLPRVADGI